MKTLVICIGRLDTATLDHEAAAKRSAFLDYI